MRGETAALILMKRHWPVIADEVRRLFGAAFPMVFTKQLAHIDWLNLAMAICPVGDVLGRLGGFSDEGETSIDIILSATSYLELATSVSESR